MNRKIILAAVLATIGLLFAGKGSVVYAETFSNVSVTKLNSMEEWDKNIQVSYEKDFALSESENPKEDIYLKFTLKQDGLVRIMQGISYENTGSANVGAYSTKLYVYSDAGLANQKMEVATPKKDGAESTYAYLEAGTYYIRSTASYRLGYSTKFTKKICIGSVDADRLLQASVKVNKSKNQATVSVDASAMGSAADSLQYVAGTYTMKDIGNDKIWKISKYASATSYKASVSGDAAKFQVTKNGTYTIRVSVKYASDGKNNVAFSVPVKVSGLDEKAPVIKGVKKGKTYKKAVTITFSDQGSGVKTATLNGKAIKSGKKVAKTGSYTLKVTDRAGNTATVKFKITK